MAAAPSLMPEALPAVTVPSFLNTVAQARQRSPSWRGLGVLVGVEGDHVALHLHLDRDDLVLEAALGDGAAARFWLSSAKAS
jgi:hypothetical protein